MDNSQLQYYYALNDVEQTIETAYKEFEIDSDTIGELNAKSESDLDGWDYCCALAFGIAGILISTSEHLEKYLAEIHKAASGSSGNYDFFQKAIGKLLYHKGDWIDSVEGVFKNRNGENAYCLFHRLLWGHDIGSLEKDNPFYLMVKQKGFFGILQTVRHLLADTMSKQGLPLPFSSLLDYTTEKGKTSNYLIRVAQKLSDESVGSKIHAEEIYSHLATIRCQDICAGAVVKTFSEIYFKIRKIDDQIRKAQIRLVAYAVNFFGEAIVGMIRQKGVPYINIPLAGILVVSFLNFCRLNAIEIKELSCETSKLVQRTEKFISIYDSEDLKLSQYGSSEDLLDSFNQADQNIDLLCDFLEENS